MVSLSVPRVVLGSINDDITLHVRQLPSAETATTVCHSISTNLGGKGANQAMGVAKMGWPSRLISKVGSDPDAAMALQQLNDAGVHTEGVRRDLDHVTGKAYIHVQEDGESILCAIEDEQELEAVNELIMQQLFEEDEEE